MTSSLKMVRDNVTKQNILIKKQKNKNKNKKIKNARVVSEVRKADKIKSIIKNKSRQKKITLVNFESDYLEDSYQLDHKDISPLNIEYKTHLLMYIVYFHLSNALSQPYIVDFIRFIKNYSIEISTRDKKLWSSNSLSKLYKRYISSHLCYFISKQLALFVKSSKFDIKLNDIYQRDPSLENINFVNVILCRKPVEYIKCEIDDYFFSSINQNLHIIFDFSDQYLQDLFNHGFCVEDISQYCVDLDGISNEDIYEHLEEEEMLHSPIIIGSLSPPKRNILDRCELKLERFKIDVQNTKKQFNYFLKDVSSEVNSNLHVVKCKAKDNFQIFLDDIDDIKKSLYDVIKHTSVDGSMYFIEYINSAIYSIYQIIRHRNKAELVWSLTVFMSNSFPGFSNTIHDIIAQYIKSFVSQISSSEKVKSEGFELDETFSPKKMFEMVISSQVVRSTRNFILSMVGLRFFSLETSNKFTKLLGEAKSTNVLDFTYSMVEMTESFFRFGHTYYITKSITSAWLDKDLIAQYIDETTELTLSYKSVYIGNDMNFIDTIAADRISATAFLAKADVFIKKGETITKTMKSNIPFKARLTELRVMRRSIMLEMQSKRRMAPMGIVLHGDPGIGKSSVLENIFKVHCKSAGRIYSPDVVYNRSPKSKYWTGYDPIIQPIIHIPEVGCISNILAQKGDETIDELLMLIDNSPYCPDQAAIEDKGVNYAMPELVVIDTNNPDMNLNTIMSAPAAIRRRFLYIETQVKKEYRKAGGVSLDTAKLKTLNLENKMDLWDFRIYEQCPQEGNVKSTKIYYEHNDPNVRDKEVFDMFGLCAQLSESYKQHKEAQKKFMEATSEDVSKYLKPKIETVTAEADLFEIYTPNYIFLNILYILYIAIWFYFCLKSYIFAFCSIIIHILVILVWFLAIYTRRTEREVKNSRRTLFALSETIRLYHTITYNNFFNNIYNLTYNASLFSFLFLKTFIYEDERYTLQKWKVFSRKIFSSLPPILLFFTIVAASTKVALKTYKVVNNIQSEGNISTSGKFTDENVDDCVLVNEKQSNCLFPLPVKKRDCDIDYDQVVNITPNLIGTPRNYNKIDELHNTIHSNVRYTVLQFKDGSRVRTKILGICRDFVLINKHCVRGELYTMHVSMSPNQASGLIKTHFTSEDYLEVAEDILLVRLIGSIFKDITFSLCDAPFSTTPLHSMFLHKDLIAQRVKTELVDDDHKMVVNDPYRYTFPEHKSGDCGTPLVSTIGYKTFLVGIHCAGVRDIGYACVINKTVLMDQLQILKDRCILTNIVSEGSFRFNTTSEIVPLGPKCPLLYEDIPSVNVYGKISDHLHITPKSTLTKSIFFNKTDYLLGIPSSYDGKPKYMAPKMRSFRNDGVFCSPENNFIKKVGVLKAPLNNRIMENVVLSFTSDLILRLREENITSANPVPLDVAQNGFPLNFYYRAMRNNTSGGFLFTGTKSKYQIKTPLDFKDDAVTPKAEVKIQVQEIINSYLNNETSHSLVGAQLKDEPRSRAKVLSGNTRVFAMSSYDMTLVNRMYLMPFYSLMCQHRNVFFTKVGINMHSSEVDIMYNTLNKFSPYIMEGDYGGYDTSMPVGIGIMANSVVYNSLKKLGYNDHSLRIVQGLLTDNLYPTVVMDGTVFTPPGFQPSGKYATAEDNSLRGIILLYYAFAIMCTPLGCDNAMNQTQKFKIRDFTKLLLPITYGDDMLCGVKEELSSYFNNITYAKFVEEIYYMSFTTSDKKEQSSRFIDISQISFLKRSFKYHPELKRMVAPLDKDSLMKSLCYYLPSKEITPEDQLIQTCNSIMRELLFHCDDEVEYEDYRQKFIRTLAENTRFGVEELLPLFPTWIELINKYSSN